MAYVSETQLEERFGSRMIIQLTDRAKPAAGVKDSAVVARAIADTTAVVDGYLLARYALPLSGAPALLTDLSGAIAIYKLHRDVAPDKIRADYDDAMKRLGDIAAGRIRLDVAGVEPQGSGGGGVISNDQDRLLTQQSLQGYI